MNEFRILIQIAIRNLFSNFLNIVIGGIILVGTLLFVVGSSLLNSIDSAMSKSIIGSVAGHIQVYSAKSKGELALFPDWEYPDLAEIPDFAAIKAPLQQVDNVKTVIPMGVNGAMISYGNTVDLTLEKLRKAINKRQRGDNSAALRAQIESYKNHARQIISVIQADYKKLSLIASKGSVDKENLAVLDYASSAQFWNTFDANPLARLEYMENKIAYLIPDADYFFLAYVGTDLDSFQSAFDRMEIVNGTKVPSGQRGLLLSKYSYETQFKLKAARRLDEIKEAIENKGSKIATDPDIKLLIKQNKSQTREIILQLDPLNTKKMIAFLQDFLKSKEGEIAKLLTAFFDVSDANFMARHKFFYDKLAPLVELYRVRPGDILTIKTFTKSGFVQSVNIKVYGTFQFKGLEKSGLAGSMSLMDVMSFRDLYGYITPEKIAETQQLKKNTGVKNVSRENAEAELFGGETTVTTVTEQRIDEGKELGNIRAAAKPENLMNRVYSQAEIEKGVILNAAIILKDPSKINETMKKIEEAARKNNLDLRVVSWQKAAGMIGQFVVVAKLILYLIVFIIFVVALVIINNAVMMATLQRIKEIGTMRAIGASRGFVLAMILVETVFLGIVFGLVGTLLGSLIVNGLGSSGIPAVNEYLYFFFSGPKLFPTLGAGSIIGAFVIIVLVTSLSALYPALIATRVSPLTAMQAEE